MIIHYGSRKLKSKLANLIAIKRFFNKIEKNLIHRLSELELANSLKDISEEPPPRRHKLYNDYKNCWSIDCSKNYRIIIKPTGCYEINDLSTITEITILDIVDYHGS